MSNRSQEIAGAVTQAIMAHRLAPGTKLGERDVGEIFNVSRIVVRQALIRLAEDGLVTIAMNRGAFVAKPSLQEALEIYDALTLLEQGVVAQLANRVSAGGWSELRHHLERQRQAVEAEDKSLADHLGQEFHAILVRMSHNRVIQQMHAQLCRRARLLRALYRSRFDYCTLLDEHEKIIELLEKGRVKRVQQLIEEHHRLVARAYLVEEAHLHALPLEQALSPYVEAVGKEARARRAAAPAADAGADTGRTRGGPRRGGGPSPLPIPHENAV